MTKKNWISVLAATALLGAAAGCQNKANEVRRSAFTPDDQPRALSNLTHAQEAVGNRKDATLHAVHFDSAGLNTLGQEKLQLMLADEEPAEPMLVYLDLPDDMPFPPAQLAVVEFLKNRGLPEAQVSVKAGPNPKAHYSAADAVVTLRGFQSNSAAAAGGGGSAAPAQGGAAAPAK